jgi:hypothetical protein
MIHVSPFNGHLIFALKPHGRKKLGCPMGVCKGILKADVRKLRYNRL